MRTRKSDSNGTTNYYYDSSNNLIGLTKGNNTLLFYYNPSGDVTSFKYNGEMYYYIKNLQGDIVKIIDRSGAEAASYKYDSWGKITAESGDSVIRELNPFRYRGYVYDTETGLYYLQSRYYDPITGRFLNADVYCDTQTGSPLSTNMFAYCENNAVTYVDDTGTWLLEKGIWFYNISQFNSYVDSIRYQRDNYKSMNYRTKYEEYSKKYSNAIGKKSLMAGIKSRFDKNVKKKSKFTSYIYGQGLSPYKSFLFGSKSTVGQTGCMAVALFNALFKKNKTMHLAQIIFELELNNYVVNNGRDGTKNDGLKDFLTAHKISYTKYDRNAYNKFYSNRNNFKVCVVLISGPTIGHAFCIVKQGKNKFKTLGFYNNDKDFKYVNWNYIKNNFKQACCIK